MDGVGAADDSSATMQVAAAQDPPDSPVTPETDVAAAAPTQGDQAVSADPSVQAYRGTSSFEGDPAAKDPAAKDPVADASRPTDTAGPVAKAGEWFQSGASWLRDKF